MGSARHDRKTAIRKFGFKRFGLLLEHFLSIMTACHNLSVNSFGLELKERNSHGGLSVILRGHDGDHYCEEHSVVHTVPLRTKALSSRTSWSKERQVPNFAKNDALLGKLLGRTDPKRFWLSISAALLKGDRNHQRHSLALARSAFHCLHDQWPRFAAALGRAARRAELPAPGGSVEL